MFTLSSTNNFFFVTNKISFSYFNEIALKFKQVDTNFISIFVIIFYSNENIYILHRLNNQINETYTNVALSNSFPNSSDLKHYYIFTRKLVLFIRT